MADQPKTSNALPELAKALAEQSELLPQMIEMVSQAPLPKAKGYRATILQTVFRQAAAAAKASGWEGTVVLKDGHVMVDQDGVRMSADRESRYFRKSGKSPARAMLRTLRHFRIPVQTVFDVGANIGEIAIYIAATEPNARVYAFEPTPENLHDFDINLGIQRKAVANLILVREAVSDRTGEIEISVGARDLNTVLVERNRARLEKHGIQISRVRTDTLCNYFERYQVKELDFLKLDTEGGEPLLAPCIRKLKGRIRASFVEISRYNTIESYMDLVDAFAQCGLTMLSADLGPIADARATIEAGLEKGPAINCWFVRNDHVAQATGAKPG